MSESYQFVPPPGSSAPLDSKRHVDKGSVKFTNGHALINSQEPNRQLGG